MISVIVSNPPYGIRLETDENIKDFMKQRSRYQHLCHLKRDISGMASDLGSDFVEQYIAF